MSQAPRPLGLPGDLTGVVPHVKRMAGRVLSPGTLRGTVREVWGLGTHIARYPLGLREWPFQGDATPASSDTFDLPVLLVHGYFHNRSGFFVMARSLRKRGFRYVYAMNYNPIGHTIPSLAARLARNVEDVMRISGAPRVHLVGHSLGGLISRWYVQEMGGHETVDHAVTIGSPHQGTYAAYAGIGDAAREMRPGSELLQRLATGWNACPTKFVNLYSDLDALIIPANSAILPDNGRVHNHLIHDLGHTSLLISPELISLVAERLATADVHTPLAEVHQLPTKRTQRPQRAKRA